MGIQEINYALSGGGPLWQNWGRYNFGAAGCVAPWSGWMEDAAPIGARRLAENVSRAASLPSAAAAAHPAEGGAAGPVGTQLPAALPPARHSLLVDQLCVAMGAAMQALTLVSQARKAANRQAGAACGSAQLAAAAACHGAVPGLVCFTALQLWMMRGATRLMFSSLSDAQSRAYLPTCLLKLPPPRALRAACLPPQTRTRNDPP